ncbi:hypothetical protein E1B28_000209 [Marasmius oreades]|uniref:F-box domain-containing protein n=1 Tax=Marasmius oreades TaxID=181124 RepID=A0A9P7V0S9_9AGAR|nr:uncharacterized protein E1B28_000209 [Marasmius oreades]KAG7098245.1 hypothetical protein E1B28_000209 [Marasmius oreades]
MSQTASLKDSDVQETGGQPVPKVENGERDDPGHSSLDAGTSELVQGFGLYIKGRSGLFLRIPPEILLEIFYAMCSGGSNLIPDPALVDVPPLLLAHVCRLWRKVALSTPKLWSRFVLDIGYCKIPLLLWYLEQSKDVPLDIVCRDLVDDPVDCISNKKIVLQQLLAHSKRWRLANLDIYNPDRWTKAIRLLSEPPIFPQLQEISLYFLRHFNDVNQIILSKLFPTPQRVQTLSTFYDYLPGSPQPFPLDTFRLVLSDNFSRIEMLAILKRFPDAKELIIPYYSLTWSFTADLAIKRHYNHACLSTLYIRFSVGDDDDEYSPYGECHYSFHLFFRTLTLPALKQLNMLYPYICSSCQRRPRPHPWDGDAFREMMLRSQCTLERLTLVNLPLRPSEIGDLIRSCPALSTLVYHECGGTKTTKHLLDLLATPSVYVQLDATLLPLPVLERLGISITFSSDSELSKESQENELAIKITETSRARQQMNLAPFKLSFELSRPLLSSTRNILDGMDIDVNSITTFPQEVVE